MRDQSQLFDVLRAASRLVLDEVREVVRAAVQEELARVRPPRPPVSTDELLDTREAIRYTGRSASTLRRWRALGLKAVQTKAGGKLTYQRSELLEFMRAHSTQCPQGTGSHE